jgi:Ca2+-binding RTX toxin-like protein
VIRFTSTSAGQTLVLAPGVTAVESVVIGTAAGVTAGLTALNVDASAVGSGLSLIGNNGANILTGTGFGDVLTGNAGNDTLIGGVGQDTVTSGTGNDRIVMLVTSGNVDVADGGTGTDTLALSGAVDGDGVVVVDLSSLIDQVTSIGGVPDDTLVQKNFENLDASGLGLGNAVTVTGSAAANLLIGSNGADTLNGGAGNDTLNGGASDDILNGGDGNDVILIGNAADHGVGEVINGGAGADVIRFTSTTGGETLVLSPDVTGVESVVIVNAAGLTTGTAALNVDASALNSGLSITGNAGANVLIGTDFNDVLKGGGGDDTLNGGLGNNLLIGGTGSDRYVVNALTDVVSEGLAAGSDIVVASINYTLTANVENLELTGSDNLNGAGNGLANILTGNSGNNVLSGLAGNDTLRGGLGNDTVNGGSGNDTFLFGSGDGQDLIQDNSGAADKVLFDGGINPLDLVISRQANDLRLAIHGSSDQITVQNWYTSSANRTETIQAGNGQTLLSTQVDQLIQAMASFTTNTGLSWDDASGGAGTAQQQTQFQGVLAASWQ